MGWSRGGESEIGNRGVGEGRLRNGGEREVVDDRGVIVRRKYGGGHMEKARKNGRLRHRRERGRLRTDEEGGG